MDEQDLRDLLRSGDRTRGRAGWRCPDEAKLAAYAEHNLSAEEEARIESHLSVCAACLEQVAFVARLPTAADASVDPSLLKRATNLVPARGNAWPKLAVRWGTVAAAAALVLVAISLRHSGAPPGQSPGAETTAAARGQMAAGAATTTAPGAPAAAQQSPSETPVKPQSTPTSAAPPGQAPPATRGVVALGVLARVEPPVYIPVALRGPRDEAAERFDAAMRVYVAGDYAGAARGLTAALKLRPDSPHVTFFLAICQMLTGSLDAAIEGLQKTIAYGDSAYLEEAHFYLAKGRLQQADLQAARNELKWTIDRRGRLETDARRLLGQIDSLPAIR